jgi:hypothetical protein
MYGNVTGTKIFFFGVAAVLATVVYGFTVAVARR